MKRKTQIQFLLFEIGQIETISRTDEILFSNMDKMSVFIINERVQIKQWLIGLNLQKISDFYTRTYPVGPLTDNERRYYTWVLQSHIDMARAVFLDYCTGFALDTFARGPVWAHKVNYRCGTGHGVGFISGVHEGPQSLRPNNPVIFKPGMTITDEPGIYETDEVGIRIENELECIDLGENQYGHWLGFAPLTLVPISTEPVLVDELSRDQINWLNDYHAHVYEMLSPRLNEDEKVWLKEKCAAIGR